MSSPGPDRLPGSPPAPATAPAEGPPLTRWQKFRLVVKVVELRLRFIALMAVTGLVFAYWDTLWNHYEKWMRPAGRAHAAAVAASSIYCPMHPQVVQDEPGSCPICGMPLSRRKKGEKAALPGGSLARVQLAPFRVAQAGIRTAEVGYAPLTETLTTVGYVEFDERRLASDLVEGPRGCRGSRSSTSTSPATTVEAGEPLAELYSPELYQAIQELLLGPAIGAARPPRPQTAAGPVAPGRPRRSWSGCRPRSSGSGGSRQAQIDEILADGQGRRHDADPLADRRARGQEERRRGPVRRRRATRCSRSPTSRTSGSRRRSTRTRSAWSASGRRSRRPSRRSRARPSRARSRSSSRTLDPATRTVERPVRPGEPRPPAPARACSPR